MEEGIEEAAIRQLGRQLGVLDPTDRERIEALSIEQLRTLAEDLLDFRIEADLRHWLDQAEVEE